MDQCRLATSKQASESDNLVLVTQIVMKCIVSMFVCSLLEIQYKRRDVLHFQCG